MASQDDSQPSQASGITIASTQSDASSTGASVSANSAPFRLFEVPFGPYEHAWEPGADNALKLVWERTIKDYPGTFRDLKYRDFLEESLSLLASADGEVLAEVCGGNVPRRMMNDSQFRDRYAPQYVL